MGAVVMCHIVMSFATPWLPVLSESSGETSQSWMVIGGLILIGGGYLAIRDHIWRPFVVLAREIPDPADMYRLMWKSLISGLSWAPVLSLGVTVLYFDGGGIWTVLQIGMLLVLWNFVEKRSRPSVTRIVRDVLPQAYPAS